MTLSSSLPDLSPYAGRWVALVGAQIAGVGVTGMEARRQALQSQPKGRIVLRFVEQPGGQPLSLSPLLARIRPYLEDAEYPIYLVGGAVRDALLGRISHDLDFALPQGGVRTSFRLADALGVPAYVLDRKRDTGRVLIPEAGTKLDFARFRGPDLEADLTDRDFTVNAIALPATATSQASLIDPCGGMSDLREAIIRQTHAGAIADDPVRSLRAVRLASALNFTISEDTALAVKQAGRQLANVSAERVRDELLRLIATSDPAGVLKQLHAFKLLAVTLPEIAAQEEVPQSPPHHEPVLSHTLSVLRWLRQIESIMGQVPPEPDDSAASVGQLLAPYRTQLQAHLERKVKGETNGRLLLRLGAMFHDCGKPTTRVVADDGRIHFYGHDQVGAGLAAERMRKLALSGEAVLYVKKIVAGHLRPLLLSLEGTGKWPPSRRAVHRFFRESGMAGLDICLIALADHLATHDGPGEEKIWHRLTTVVEHLLLHYYRRYAETIAPAPFLDGRELIALLGLKQGPEVGRILRLIEENQAAGEITSREEAIQFARQLR